MMRRAGSASPETISAERARSRASDTALSGRPTMAKAGSPGTISRSEDVTYLRIKASLTRKKTRHPIPSLAAL